MIRSTPTPAEPRAEHQVAPRWTTFERVFACTLVLIVGAVLVARASGPSIWWDEIFTYRMAQRPFGFWVRTLANGEINGGLHHVVIRIGRPLFGDDLVLLRLPAIAGWVAGIPVFHAIARRIAPLRLSLVATTVFAVAPLGIRHAMEIRMYSFASTAALGSTLALIWFVERPSRRRALAYGVIAAAALYTHYFLALTLAAHALAVLSHLDRRTLVRTSRPAVALVAVATIPLGSVIVRRGGQQISWISERSASEVLDIGARWVGITWRPDGPWQLMLIPAVMLIAAGTIAVVRDTVRRSSAEQSTTMWIRLLIATLVAFPVVATFVISWLIQPVLVSRYLIIVIGPVILLALIGVQAIRAVSNSFGTPVAAALAGIAIACAVPSVADSLRATSYEGEDWRTVGGFVATNVEPGDLVVTTDHSQGEQALTGFLFHLGDSEVAARASTIERLADPDHAPTGPPPSRLWIVNRDPVLGLAEQIYRVTDTMGGSWRLDTEWRMENLEVGLYLPADVRAD